MVTLKNDRVTVQIAEYGAEMRRIVFNVIYYIGGNAYGKNSVWCKLYSL